MTADSKLLPLPKWMLEAFTDPTIERLCDYTRANVTHATATKDAEIERLRAALESLRAHMGNVLMVREGIIRALEEVRDGQRDEIHRLRAENKDLVKSNEQVQKLALDTLADRDELRAETEALRVEVKSLQTLRDVVIENHGYWKDRAERLADALRHLRNHTSVNSYQIELIDAALRDHDQEDKNDGQG